MRGIINARMQEICSAVSADANNREAVEEGGGEGGGEGGREGRGEGEREGEREGGGEEEEEMETERSGVSSHIYRSIIPQHYNSKCIYLTPQGSRFLIDERSEEK